MISEGVERRYKRKRQRGRIRSGYGYRQKGGDRSQRVTITGGIKEPRDYGVQSRRDSIHDQSSDDTIPEQCWQQRKTRGKVEQNKEKASNYKYHPYRYVPRSTSTSAFRKQECATLHHGPIYPYKSRENYKNAKQPKTIKPNNNDNGR